MKRFNCGAVVPGCTAAFTAHSTEGILTQVAEHAAADHGLSDLSDEVKVAVLANISG
jgi:predicted small metal-binding protein